MLRPPIAGTQFAPIARMSGAAALIAEEDRDLRALLSAALTRAGYMVLQAATSAQVQEEAGWLAARGDDTCLLVLSEGLAAYPTNGLATALGLWRGRYGRRVHVLFTKSLGSEFSPPDVHPCEPVGLLEKPFDVDGFQELCASILERTGHSVPT